MDNHEDQGSAEQQSRYPIWSIYEKYANTKMKITDSNDNTYESVADMWSKELDEECVEKEKSDKKALKLLKGERIGSLKDWYSGGKDYWDKKPATNDGVLEGYGDYHDMETEYSKKILNEHLYLMPGKGRAIEAGAGIGRISKAILHDVFAEIDLQEYSG